MKMNIVLMILGAVIFAVGAVMTFNKKPEQEKEQDQTVNLTTNVTNVTNEQRSEHTTIIEQKKHVTPDAQEDENKKKGNAFEDYVANVLNANSLTIKDWNKGTITEDGAFGENALNPDMLVVDKDTKIGLEYWIECKYRSYIPKDGFQLKPTQMDRYKQKQRDSKRKILIALGLGGTASQPEKFYLIPLDSLARYKYIPEKYIGKYIVEDPKWKLKEYVRKYFFEEVFRKDK